MDAKSQHGYRANPEWESFSEPSGGSDKPQSQSRSSPKVPRLLPGDGPATPFDEVDRLAGKQAELAKDLPFVPPHPSELQRSSRRHPRSSDPPLVIRHSSNSGSPSISATVSNSYSSVDTSLSPIDINALEYSFFTSFSSSKEGEDDESDDFGVDDGSNIKDILNQSATKKNWTMNFSLVQDITSIPPKIIARQLSLIDAESFKLVTRGALESLAWSGPDKWKKAPSVAQMIQQFNQITLWVSHEILESTDSKLRLQKISHFIASAKACLELNNFNGTKCILSGLQASPVFRLEKTWAMISRAEKNLYDKMCELLSPNDNYSKYRRKLKRTASPLVPFLGVHLGDLIYLNEAKRKEMAKVENLEAARQRESQIGRLIDQLLNFQAKCNYDIDLIPPVRALLMQERFISELQNFLEDRMYQLSYDIEPRKSKDGRDSASPASTLERNKSAATDYDQGVNNDLLSLSLEQYSKSLSFDNIGASSLSSSYPNEKQQSSPSFLNQQSRTGKEKKQGSSSLGSKKGGWFIKQASAIAEDSDNNASWLKDEVLVNMSHSPSVETYNPFEQDVVGSSSSSSKRYRSISTHSSLTKDTSDLFGNKNVLIESVLHMKMKKDKLASSFKVYGWHEYWVRLFPGVIIFLPKKPLSLTATERVSKDSKSLTFDIKSTTTVEIAADYKKKPNVFRLKPSPNVELLIEAKNEAELYEWVAYIHKALKSQSLSR